MRDIIVKKVAELSVIVLLSVLSGCGHLSAFAKSEVGAPWEVSIAMPMYYGAKVIDIYGINTSENWTVSLIGLKQAGNHNVDVRYVRKFFSPQQYDGLGIILSSLVNGHAIQPGGTFVPPNIIYVKWISLYDNTLYYTKIDLSENVRKFMMHQNYAKGRKSPYYINSIVLGFLPNGNIKVWLYGYSRYVYIKEQNPEQKIKDKVVGEYDPKKYKDIIKYIKDKAIKNGVDIIPVRWEKVNKVTVEGSSTVENFSDIDEALYM